MFQSGQSHTDVIFDHSIPWGVCTPRKPISKLSLSTILQCLILHSSLTPSKSMFLNLISISCLYVCMCSWAMYEEPNYRGRMYIVERGDYCSHNEWQAQNPNIQSLRRVVNYF